MIYIVDIDHTICNTPEIDGKQRYDLSTPYPERIERINKLYDEGHTIIYWTARGSGSGINQFKITHGSLLEWGAKFHEVRLGKPSYDVWIDDKAINDKQYFGEL
jgi:hypothetical protein